MNGQPILQAAVWLGSLTLDVTVIIAIGWLATLGFRKNAGIRHGIWVAAFIAILATPMVILLSRPARQVPIAVRIAPESALAPVAEKAATVPAPVPAFPKPQHRDWKDLADASVYLWPVGVVLAFAWTGSAFLGIRSIYRYSTPVPEASQEVGRLAQLLGIRRRVRLHLSLRPIPPAAMTWGTGAPVILLPSNSPLWTPDRRQAVLLHELAHVRRFDCFTQLLSVSACVLFWYHPLVWLAAKTMRSDAETAADDMVVRSGIAATDYAADLVALAAAFAGQRQPHTSLGVPILKKSGIENRVQSLIDPTVRRTGFTATHAVSLALLGGFVVVGITCIRPQLVVNKDSARDRMLADATELIARRSIHDSIEENHAKLLLAIEECRTAAILDQRAKANAADDLANQRMLLKLKAEKNAAGPMTTAAREVMAKLKAAKGEQTFGPKVSGAQPLMAMTPREEAEQPQPAEAPVEAPTPTPTPTPTPIEPPAAPSLITWPEQTREDAEDAVKERSDEAKDRADDLRDHMDDLRDQSNADKRKSDEDKRQSDEAKREGERAKNEGHRAKLDGDRAKAQGWKAKLDGDRAKRQEEKTQRMEQGALRQAEEAARQAQNEARRQQTEQNKQQDEIRDKANVIQDASNELEAAFRNRQVELNEIQAKVQERIAHGQDTCPDQIEAQKKALAEARQSLQDSSRQTTQALARAKRELLESQKGIDFAMHPDGGFSFNNGDGSFDIGPHVPNDNRAIAGSTHGMSFINNQQSGFAFSASDGRSIVLNPNDQAVLKTSHGVIQVPIQPAPRVPQFKLVDINVPRVKNPPVNIPQFKGFHFKGPKFQASFSHEEQDQRRDPLPPK